MRGRTFNNTNGNGVTGLISLGRLTTSPRQERVCGRILGNESLTFIGNRTVNVIRLIRLLFRVPGFRPTLILNRLFRLNH